MDSAARWDKVESLFHEATVRPPHERDAFLRARCDDAEIRREVAELLEAHEDDAEPVQGALAAVSVGGTRSLDELRRIGHYELLRVIASGGMGTVFEARQDRPKRVVALKLMHRGFGDQAAKSRFEYEAEILGQLHHPGIAHVYESGTVEHAHGRQPWFAMELVVGAKTLTRHAHEASLAHDAQVELLASVCDAVHHGHQRGVIHRDLKPANILVDEAGAPKVIDFGVAKAVEGGLDQLETLAGQIVGTPRYMAPEQVTPGGSVDVRTDVHALGLVAFEMLVGKPAYPVEGKTVIEALALIRESEPRLQLLEGRGVAVDLRACIATAISRDPAQRYASADAFGDDLRRFLGGETVRARPPSRLYSLQKFAWRNRLLVASMGAVFMALSVGVVVATLGRLEAQRQEAQAESARAAAERARDEALWGQAFLADLLRGADPRQGEGAEVTLARVLDLAVARLDDEQGGSTSARARLRQTLGETYHGVGNDEAALEQLTKALELTPESDPEHDRVLRALAQTLANLDRFEEANRRAHQAVDAAGRLHGHDSLQTRDARRTLASVLRHGGELESALEQARAVHAAETDPERKAQAASALGAIYYDLGRYAEAIEFFESAHAVHRKKLGAGHPDVVATAVSLASSYTWERRFKDAERVFQEVLTASLHSLGKHHPTRLNLLDHYAGMLSQANRLDEAREIHEEVFEARKHILGPAHSSTFRSMANYAATLTRAGELEDAVDVYQRAIELADQNPLTLGRPAVNVYANYAKSLRDLGRLDEAEETMAEGLARAKERLGREHYVTWVLQSGHAGILEDQGRLEAAEREMQEAYERLVVIRGAENRFTQDAKRRLAGIYRARHKPQLAAALE